MTHSIRKMANPGGKGAGQTATAPLPIGLTYHQLIIRMVVVVNGSDVEVPVADWGNYLNDVRLIVDGENTFTMAAADIVKHNQHVGVEMEPGALPIFLSRPWARTAGGEDQTSYKTGAGVSTFTMEIDQKDGINVKSLEVYARQSAGQLPDGRVLAWGPHLNVKRFSKQQSLVGVAEIADIPRSPYNLLSVQLDTDEIAKAEVVINNTTIIDMDRTVLNTAHHWDKRKVIAGQTFVDFDSGGRLVEAMPMAVQDARFKFDFTDPGNYTLYTVSISPN